MSLYTKKDRNIALVGGLAIFLNIIIWLTIILTVIYIVENKNEIAKKAGETARELKQSFDEGMQESDTTYKVE